MNGTTDGQSIAEGRQFLIDSGLNLFAVLDCAALPEDVCALMSTSIHLSDYARLVVIGNTGRKFWHALQGESMSVADPIDSLSKKLTHRFCTEFIQDPAYQLLFPSDLSIPLQRIGALLGWGQVSPLGVGISGEYGLWFAYRSAFLTHVALPVSENTPPLSPCDACVDKPCISHCPAAAVSVDNAFDISACFNFRLRDHSPCLDRCVARMACPVGVQYQYPLEMIQYIYTFSMATVRRYRSL